jgi:hypothetical protein
MHFLRGCRNVFFLATQNKAHLYKLGGLLLTIVGATTSWMLAIALASQTLGIPSSAFLLVGLGVIVAALCVVAAAAMRGDP